MKKSQIANRKSQIERLRPLVEAETGMDFSGSRFARLCDAVEKVAVKQSRGRDLDRFFANPDERGPLLEQLTAELTVGESFFFRNEHHFDALRKHVIPEILQRNGKRREVRIWSAGCAAGEEPYSLAILLDQILHDAKKRTGPICAQHPSGRSGKLDPSAFSRPDNQESDWRLSILGTDINTHFLHRARAAEFRAWSFRRTDIYQDSRYFTQQGEDFCLRPSVRDCVRFLYLNLVKDVYPSPLNGTIGLDLILFRNVAIYLQADVVRAIVKRFFHCLHPGGWLLLGEAEVSQMRPEEFAVRRIGRATFFQKPGVETRVQPSHEPLRPVLPGVYGGIGVPRAKPAPPERAARPPASPAKPTAQARAPSKPAAPLADDLRFDWQHVEQLLMREDFAAAESELNKIRDRGKRANMRLQCVRRLLELSHVARAHEMLDVCLHEEPLMIDGHLLKASLAEERGELGEAETACRRALYLDRNCAMAHFHLALVQQQRGDLAGGRRSLALVQKIAKSQDPNALVEHGDGVCYGRLYEMVQSMLEF